MQELLEEDLLLESETIAPFWFSSIWVHACSSFSEYRNGVEVPLEELTTLAKVDRKSASATGNKIDAEVSILGFIIFCK